MEAAKAQKRIKSAIINKEIIRTALMESFLKLSPKVQIKNLVMFVVYLGAIATTVITILDFVKLGTFKGLDVQLTLWLWFTLLFSNFSEALAEGKGKAQAQSLRKSKMEMFARKLSGGPGGKEIRVPAVQLKKGDLVICEARDVIPGDGEVIEGIASVDESAITGESAPVIRESGGDRSAVTAGTLVISDRIVIRISVEQGESYLDKLIQLVESSARQPTPNEVALSILLAALTLVFVFAVASLKGFLLYSEASSGGVQNSVASLPVLIALLVCLIPTTIAGLLSAIGISGMERMLAKNVIATSGKAVEASGDIDVLLLDKTGTITIGNRMADGFIPAPGVSEKDLARGAYYSSLSDQTPEGRSIVSLVNHRFPLNLKEIQSDDPTDFIPFSAETRMSGVDIRTPNQEIRQIRKGSCDAIEKFILAQGGGPLPPEVLRAVEKVGMAGGTPLVVCENKKVLGVVALKDIIKPGIRERLAQLRKMGIRTVMITGDNKVTASTIAAEAGVDDFLAEANPETKLARIRKEQEDGHMVAMVGDGTNDAPALAQADVGLAMNTGTQAAREAGNMVDLDSDPTKLIEVVETGKQLLMTRGALTTFSVANDIAKYFAILPAMFSGLYLVQVPGQDPAGVLSVLNIMHLHSPESSILSAVIFNALAIVFLIPLAIKGVAYKPRPAKEVLLKNILVYGLGGVFAPFVGIKILDLLLVFLGLI